jgi:hypothetical protein
MPTLHNSNISHNEPHTDALRPALASIPVACKYLGDVSRAKFYADVLPLLETVHIGSRHLVVVASMDRLIASSAVQGRKECLGMPLKRITQGLASTDSASTESPSPHYRSRPCKAVRLELPAAQEDSDA